ncbi:hypothetical protein TNCV_2234151 [Trichonephila clavipes]|nr:hypothetical protein TNCV_2234151 [Trichonephila clavipes]
MHSRSWDKIFRPIKPKHKWCETKVRRAVCSNVAPANRGGRAPHFEKHSKLTRHKPIRESVGVSQSSCSRHGFSPRNLAQLATALESV